MNLSAEVLLAAKNLADAIKSDDRYAAAEAAGKAYSDDEKISTALTEYSVQQQALTEEYGKDEHDEALINAIQNRINEIYKDIVESPVYEAYKVASDGYQAYYRAVMEELEYQLTGKRSSCTHDCSTCGGCH